MTVTQLLTVLESIKPLRHFQKLRDFMAFKLPPGFPVKLGKYIVSIAIGTRAWKTYIVGVDFFVLAYQMGITVSVIVLN